MFGHQIKYFLLCTFIIYPFTLTFSEQFDITSNKIDYRSEMRTFVEEISRYGKSHRENFIVIPQNGQELLTNSGEAMGEPVQSYVQAIDGVGREDLFYGYTGDDKATPANANRYMLPFLDLAEILGVDVLTIDYCSTLSKMDNSYDLNEDRGYISLSADSRGLENIPSYPPAPYNVNSRNIRSLPEAENFLYLINPEKYTRSEDLLSKISETNYDILIIDLFDNDGKKLTEHNISHLRRKANGGSRLVFAYMSIGEAEEYRHYWKSDWESHPPLWLDEENPNWEGNYKVKYWEPGWKKLILGKPDSYLDMILESGFDGVYLDIVDAFEHFE